MFFLFYFLIKSNKNIEKNLDKMLKSIIELPKFKKKKPKVADILEKWLYVIGGDKEMIEEYKKENGEIKEAIEQLEEMSADEYERELYEIREKSRLTYNTEMNEARRQGLQQGREEGITEEKLYNIPINVDTIKENEKRRNRY